MFQLSKARAEKFFYAYKKGTSLEPRRIDKIKKNDSAGPASYEVPTALQQSAQMRSSIKNSIPKSKNVNYIRSLLELKNKIPGVGHYDTIQSNKQKSIPTTSLRMKRHWISSLIKPITLKSY